MNRVSRWLRSSDLPEGQPDRVRRPFMWRVSAAGARRYGFDHAVGRSRVGTSALPLPAGEPAVQSVSVLFWLFWCRPVGRGCGTKKERVARQVVVEEIAKTRQLSSRRAATLSAGSVTATDVRRTRLLQLGRASTKADGRLGRGRLNNDRTILKNH